VEDSKWERYGALGGVLLVGLDLTVALLGGEPRASDPNRSEIAHHFADKASAIDAGLWQFEP
jgi:hypothetical protein